MATAGSSLNGRTDPAWLAWLWTLFVRFGPPGWSRYIRMYWTGARLVITAPMLWLVLFFLVPFLIVLKMSFSKVRLAIPPYEPLLEWVGEQALIIKLNLANYAFLFTDSLYISSYLYSVKVAFVSTILCLLIGYPMAYAIARSSQPWRNVLLMLIILPFWTSFLLRVYAWIGLLKSNGVINNVLMALGIIDEPITMLQTDFAVYIGIVYSYLPFMILPLYANLEKHDHTLLEAAQDLGARPLSAFLHITLPLSMPGIIAGSLLVFIPAVGEYVIPSLLGRTDQLMIGRVLYDEFFGNRDWPVASAVAILMLLLLVVPIMLFQRYQSRAIGARE
ncbi:MAG TPA: ABC transporter permease subunit [Steroidobacteraceae bacterium]